MSERKAKLAPSKEVADNYVTILGGAAEEGVRARVKAMAEAEQYGGTVIVIVTVPFVSENGEIHTSQALVSNCSDKDTVAATILDVAVAGIAKRSDWAPAQETRQ
jgi:hypothetical protein